MSGDGAPGGPVTREVADAPLRGEELDRTLVRGLAWTTLAKGATQLLTWASTLVVARILTPEDYGLIGMATIYLGFVTLVSEFGLGASVVILRDLTARQIAQMNGLAVLFGVGGLLLTLAGAAPLGAFFSAPGLPAVMFAMSSVFLISGFRIVPESLLQRDLDFRTLALINSGSSVAAAAVAITAAAMGGGYWALVGGYIAGPLARTLAAVSLRPQPFGWPRRRSLSDAFDLSANIIMSRIAWYVYTTADFLVVGRILGQRTLGFYNIGWTLASLPVDRITAIVTRVVSPVFSAVQDSAPELRRYLLLLTEGIATVTFPAALGLALVADDFVLVVLGDKWAGAIVPLQILSVYAAFRSITPLLPHILNVVGESRFEMWVSVATAVVMPLAFVAGTRWGVVGVAAAWVLIHPLLSIPRYAKIFQKIELPIGAYLTAIWPPLSRTTAMIIAVLAVRGVSVDLAGPARLGVQILTGAAVYSGLLFTVHRARLQLLRRAISLMRHRSPLS